jgi:uncharacterized protein YhhL (DUF1145 family)
MVGIQFYSPNYLVKESLTYWQSCKLKTFSLGWYSFRIIAWVYSKYEYKLYMPFPYPISGFTRQSVTKTLNVLMHYFSIVLHSNILSKSAQKRYFNEVSKCRLFLQNAKTRTSSMRSFIGTLTTRLSNVWFFKWWLRPTLYEKHRNIMKFERPGWMEVRSPAWIEVIIVGLDGGGKPATW